MFVVHVMYRANSGVNGFWDTEAGLKKNSVLSCVEFQSLGRFILCIHYFFTPC